MAKVIMSWIFWIFLCGKFDSRIDWLCEAILYKEIQAKDFSKNDAWSSCQFSWKFLRYTQVDWLIFQLYFEQNSLLPTQILKLASRPSNNKTQNLNCLQWLYLSKIRGKKENLLSSQVGDINLHRPLRWQIF